MSETTELQRAVESLTKTIESLRHELVRKDVYASDQRALDARLTGMHIAIQDIRASFNKREERDTQNRRLIVASFVMPLLLSLLLLYVAAQTGSV